MYFVVKSTLAT